MVVPTAPPPSLPSAASRRPLAQLGVDRALALDPDELLAVRDHFVAAGRDPTDVELETIAQTWSEHCAHKTFRATILTDDGDELPPLLDRLRAATDAIDAPFVRSAFVGNAGIVSFATARRSPSRPRPTTTPRRSSRSAAPTPASAA